MSELRCQEFAKCGVWNLMFDGHLLDRSAMCVYGYGGRYAGMLFQSVNICTVHHLLKVM